MKKEYLFVLSGMLLTAIIFSVIQLTLASPAAPNPGHTAAEIEAGTSGQVLTTIGGVATWSTTSTVPSGMIAMWHGTIANIPAGWVICDGTNGTPNLLQRFVQGVATAATEPGATGGAATVALSVAQMPSHTHAITDRKWGTSGGGAYNASVQSGTTVSNKNTGSAGSGSAHQNEPPYYDVAFIMKQ